MNVKKRYFLRKRSDKDIYEIFDRSTHDKHIANAWTKEDAGLICKALNEIHKLVYIYIYLNDIDTTFYPSNTVGAQWKRELRETNVSIKVLVNKCSSWIETTVDAKETTNWNERTRRISDNKLREFLSLCNEIVTNKTIALLNIKNENVQIANLAKYIIKSPKEYICSCNVRNTKRK